MGTGHSTPINRYWKIVDQTVLWMIRIICKMILPFAVWTLCKRWQKTYCLCKRGRVRAPLINQGHYKKNVEPDCSLCCRSAPLNDVDHLQNEISFCRPSSLQELPATQFNYRLSSFVCLLVVFLLFLSVPGYKCCLIVCKLVLFFYCFYPYQVIFAAGWELPAAQFNFTLKFCLFPCLFLLFLSVPGSKFCLSVCKLLLFFYCFYPYQVIFAAGWELPAAQFSCSLSPTCARTISGPELGSARDR